MAFEHRADIIIRTARARSGNKDFGRNQGVAQREFVQYLNDAQARIYNLLLQTRSSLFQRQVYLDTTARSPYVELPEDDIFLGHNVVAAMYSHNGNAVNYAPLELRTVRQEVSVQGYPGSYFLLEDQLVLSPYPGSGVQNAIKLTYQKVIPSLDIRRAKVASGSVATYVLTDNATLLDETEDDLADGWVDYVSFVDADGDEVVSELGVVSYTAATRTLVLSATPSASIVGSYLVFGKNVTTHCQLPEICERYLTEYTVMRAQMGDSNKESVATSPVLMAIEKEIVDAVEELEEDISAIPILDSSMMNYADSI